MHPLIHITDSILIPTYLLIISLVYSFSLFWLIKRARKFDLSQNDALDIALAVMVGGLVGARAMHVLYENPKYFFENPLEAFNVLEGGFVFYGGALLAFLSALLVIKIKKLDFYIWADVFAPIAPIGYAFGRLACFFNGCCYGKVCDLSWAVNFPHLDGSRHPTQLYAILLELFLFTSVLWFEKFRTQKSFKNWLSAPGQLFFYWLIGHSINRIIMEYFRDDYRGSFVLDISISSWISLLIFASATYLFFKRTVK